MTFNNIYVIVKMDINFIKGKMLQSFPKWLEGLNEEDLNFLKKFILASGSLKDLAASYGVTYPTIRLRLDRLIEKTKILDAAENESDFERVLRACFVDGKLDSSTFELLRNAYKAKQQLTRS